MNWAFEVILFGTVPGAVLNVPMISVVLVAIALLWSVTMFFDRIMLYLTAKKGDNVAESSKTSRGQKPKKKVTVLVSEPDSEQKLKSKSANSLLGLSKVTSASMLSDTPSADPDDDDDENEEDYDEDDDDNDQGKNEEEDNSEDDEYENDDDALNEDGLGEDEDGVVMASTISSQLPALNWEDEQHEDVPLELLPDASYEADVQELLDAEPEGEPVLLSAYANRIDIIKTTAFNLGRLVRKRDRRQQTEEVAERLVEIINHYKMNADRNVGDIFRMESARVGAGPDVQEDLFSIYARLQSASLTTELDKSDGAKNS